MADPRRSPDPTLSTFRAPVGIIMCAPAPAVAHRVPGPGSHTADCGTYVPTLISSSYACWFAVPCRGCFLGAPPRGQRTCGGDLPPADLAWQVPGREAADG